MVDEYKQTRDEMVARFRDHAAALFAANPARRSVMLAVAQYWDDNASDEVHGYIVVSTRETPVWPHECEHDYGDESNDWADRGSLPLIAGEECWLCGGHELDMTFYGGYEDATVNAFELFCREGCSQHQPYGEAYVPCMLARRGESIEWLGHAQRFPGATLGSTGDELGWPDTRARELFAEVCHHGDDDASRSVLADYLLEAYPEDPRGEALSLGTPCELRWIDPLGEVIPPGCAHFERGFLARAEVYAAGTRERDRVLNATAWGSVREIRFVPGSVDVIAPTMLGLRALGPLRDGGARALERAERPWAIERLTVAASAEIARLTWAATLPRLVELDVAATFVEAMRTAARTAPWWRQLRRLGFVAGEVGSLSTWSALRVELGVPELSIAAGDELATGWQIGFRSDTIVVRAAGWSGDGTLGKLGELLAGLPEQTRVVLVPGPLRTFDASELAWLGANTPHVFSI